jgi:hypothetical protein
VSIFFGIEMDASDFSMYSAKVVSVANLFDSTSAWASTLSDIGDYFVQRILEEFDTEGGSSGGWPSLSPDYQAWKEENYGSLPILYLTGDYERSFQWDGAGRDAIIIHSTLESTKQTWHTFGTERMPARPPFVVTGKDLSAVDQMFAGGFDAVFFSRF